MAVWGAEIGNEDDAERAVRAGFELVDVVGKLSAETGAPGLALRVGIHTGEAAVGPVDDHMGFVTGDLVNTAARLESVAEPGTILVGDKTRSAASRSIAFDPVAPQHLKGKTLPVVAWRATRVLSERGGRGRAESLEPPFVGRGDELRLLKDLLDTVGTESRARLVSLVGEAGIGKSRLVWEFLKYIDGLVDDIYWHEGRSPAYGDGVTFWALSEMIKGRAGIMDGDDAAAVADRIDQCLATYVADQSDRDWIRPRLAAVLGEGEAPGDRAELDAAIRAFFEGVSDQGTTVLVFEDLHWADAALIDFVEDLTDWWRSRPILIVTMARPDLLDRRPSWGTGRQGFISINLGPMSDGDMSALVEGAVPGLPAHIAGAIVERAAGIPLYAVELLRGLLAQGELEGEAGDYRFVGDTADLVIPESLQAVIGARLDRLDAEERALIQDAAVLGQTFTVSALAVLTGRDHADLTAQLHALSRRELIEPVRDGRAPEQGEYRFLQGLIRDVALGRLSRETRSTRHLAVATHLESLDDPELAGIVASHYLQALDASPMGEAREGIRRKASISMAQAAARAADLKSHQQVLSISRTALEIAESDDERMPIWERMVVASGRLADVSTADHYASLAIGHLRDSGDTLSLARVSHSLALAFADNNQPERAVDLLRPFVSGDLDEPELARAATLYARAMMLNQMPGVVEVAERALLAAERLRMVPEILDALITKATVFGHVGRNTEARIIMEGATALAEQHGLGFIVARGQNNLAFILVGIDDAASVAIAEDAFRTSQRLGDRSLILFHNGQMAFSLVTLGEFDRAEAVLAHPMLEDPPPAVRASIATAQLMMAVWRGDVDRADRLQAELDTLLTDVDDPQVLSYMDDNAIDIALAHHDAETALALSLKRLEMAPWNEFTDSLRHAVFAAGLLGDVAAFSRLTQLLRPHHPRFEDDARFCEIVVDGTRTREIDAIIGQRAEGGFLLDVVRFSAAAARFAPPEPRGEYLATVRKLCTERGWNGALGLVESYLG